MRRNPSPVAQRARLFLIVIVVAVAVLPFLFASLFQSDNPAETGAAGCLEVSMAAFERGYGQPLTSEVVKIETACKDHGHGRAGLSEDEIRAILERP